MLGDGGGINQSYASTYVRVVLHTSLAHHLFNPYENILWNLLVLQIPWCFTMVSLFQSNMVSMVHRGILPWFTCFKATWYTMVSMVHRGILPWFTCLCMCIGIISYFFLDVLISPLILLLRCSENVIYSCNRWNTRSILEICGKRDLFLQ